jgi:hypothetical protein
MAILELVGLHVLEILKWYFNRRWTYEQNSSFSPGILRYINADPMKAEQKELTNWWMKGVALCLRWNEQSEKIIGTVGEHFSISYSIPFGARNMEQNAPMKFSSP